MGIPMFIHPHMKRSKKEIKCARTTISTWSHVSSGQWYQMKWNNILCCSMWVEWNHRFSLSPVLEFISTENFNERNGFRSHRHHNFFYKKNYPFFGKKKKENFFPIVNWVWTNQHDIQENFVVERPIIQIKWFSSGCSTPFVEMG